MIHKVLRKEITRIKLRRRGSFSQSTKISLFLRPFLERRWARSLVGAPLVLGVIMVSNHIVPADGVSEVLTNHTAPNQVLEVKLSQITPTAEPLGYILPVEELTGVSQYFSYGHPALDMRAPMYSQVTAMQEGTVSEVVLGNVGYGRYVVIDHSNGVSSMYSHLDTISVKPGESVYAGRRIGHVGMTGWSTGPHVHFEIHENGSAVNPLLYLKPALEAWQTQALAQD